MAVFTRTWVDENLAAFLDGRSASAIVTLGQAAIDAKDEEERLVAEVDRLDEAEREAEKQRKTNAQKAAALARQVQDQIVSELQEFDYKHFTKSRYSAPKVSEDLRSFRGDVPDATAHAEALKLLGEGAPIPVATAQAPPAALPEGLHGLSGLLAETPTRVALASLEGTPAAQQWVERGLSLHEHLDECLFCSGSLTDERRRELASHFDASWLEIRSRANALLAEVSSAMTDLTAWHSSLPEVALLAGDLQPAYGEAVARAEAEVDARLFVLEEITGALELKVDDPSATPVAPNLAPLATAPSAEALTSTVAEHNERARRHGEATTERRKVILEHLIGSQSRAFCDLEVKAQEAKTTKEGLQKEAAEVERRLAEVRQKQFTTVHMANTLTRDLARVYGKSHLSVTVTDDGKSYACRRGDGAGTDLSEGERTTLSLLYFLRKLEDEQVPGVDHSQRIVVIDDPSSSLDREALFATHQWLVDTLNGFGQSIVLTHDFSLLRLSIKSQGNAWGKSSKLVRDGDADELRFPRVTFLEMFTSTVESHRSSKFGPLPRVLLNHTSEYAYLFRMVMAGVAESQDHERLLLLPNAARRVLEVFASYKAPHRSHFIQQLEVLVQADLGEPFRDVYDFCNRYSHGEGSESIDVLDARAVHGQIRRCMEFLRAVDDEHFQRMCKATDTDPTVLS
jgi:wobble nucleotide-excising tRNase